MERIKGKDVVFFIDENSLYFCTNLQCMKVINVNKNNTRGHECIELINKVRTGKIKSARSVYSDLDAALTCIAVLPPLSKTSYINSFYDKSKLK